VQMITPPTALSGDAVEPDDRDWTWVVSQPCPECGFDPAQHDPVDTGSALRSTVPRWQAVLAGPDVVDRPRTDFWSALEYGCHVRDVCTIFGGRLAQMLAQDGARFDNWDQDATALEKRYRETLPADVSRDLSAAAADLAAAFDAVPDDAWRNRGFRSNGSEFTVRTFALYLLHDIVHHLHDVGG